MSNEDTSYGSNIDPSRLEPVFSDEFTTSSGRNTTTYTYGDGSTLTIDSDTGIALSSTNATDTGGGAGGSLSDIVKTLWETGKNFASTPAGMATILAGMYSMSGAGRAPQVETYKGKIPTYTGIREAIPQQAYTPYSGQAVMGRQFFTPMQYVKENADAAAQQAKTQAQEMAAAIPAPPPAAVSPLKKAAPAVQLTPQQAQALVDATAQRFYQPSPATGVEMGTVTRAQGGILEAMQGKYLRGASDGMADKIPATIEDEQPARLSHGEFVVPADVVSHLGNGNSEAGAKALYKMMDRVRQARTGTTKQGKEINPDKYTGIASYNQGGTVNFQTGGAANSSITSSNPTGATTATSLAPWVGDYVTDYLGKAQALANTPYQAYTGPLTAGASPLQTQAFEAAGQVNPFATFDAAAAQQYMNPFLQAALEPQLREARRQADISRLQQLGRMSKAGAYGGGRQAIMESELNRNLMTNLADITGKGYATAFDKAMGQYNVGRERTAADISSLAQMGAQQRAVEQEGIEAARKDFEAQRQFPYEQLKFQQSMLQGLPVGTTSTTPNLSDLQQLGLTLKQLSDIYGVLSKTTGP